MKKSDLVWKTLMTELPKNNSEQVSKIHSEGFKTLDFPIEYSPCLEEINEILRAKTQWQAYEAFGFVPYGEYFGRMMNYEFPINTYERSMEELYHSEQPDRFHDVYGHLPFLVDRKYTDVTLHMSELALKYAQNDVARELFQRYYFHLFECGLIREEEGAKVLGAGIAASIEESRISVSSVYKHFEHNPIVIMETPFNTNEDLKPQYFVLNELDDAIAVKGLIVDYIDFRVKRNDLKIDLYVSMV